MNVRKHAGLLGVLSSFMLSLAVLAFRDGNYEFAVYFGMMALIYSFIVIREIFRNA